MFNDLLQIDLTSSRENYSPVHEGTAWRSSSAVWLRPSSMSRSAWSRDSRSFVRSWSPSASKPNRRLSNRDSSVSRSPAVNLSIACSMASTVLIEGILPLLFCDWQLVALMDRSSMRRRVPLRQRDIIADLIIAVDDLRDLREDFVRAG